MEKYQELHNYTVGFHRATNTGKIQKKQKSLGSSNIKSRKAYRCRNYRDEHTHHGVFPNFRSLINYISRNYIHWEIDYPGNALALPYWSPSKGSSPCVLFCLPGAGAKQDVPFKNSRIVRNSRHFGIVGNDLLENKEKKTMARMWHHV